MSNPYLYKSGQKPQPGDFVIIQAGEETIHQGTVVCREGDLVRIRGSYATLCYPIANCQLLQNASSVLETSQVPVARVYDIPGVA